MRVVLKAALFATALGVTGFVAGCDQRQNGVAEKAGEKLDNATDDLTDKRDITDGPGENLGEKLDGAAGDKKASDNN